MQILFSLISCHLVNVERAYTVPGRSGVCDRSVQRQMITDIYIIPIF